jgi:tricorn protease
MPVTENLGGSMQSKLLRMTLIVSLMIVSIVTSSFADGPSKLLRSPTISESHIAFEYANDIWIANRDGSNARRLTIHEGMEYSPSFSPDGKLLAFTAQYDGNTDVYIVSIDGGAPKRLTFHPAGDGVLGWSPDGEVLFRSNRTSTTRRYGKIFKVSVDGGFPEELIIPRASRFSISEDGKYYAYTFSNDPFNTWKHYRGGQTPEVWIFDVATNEIVTVPRDNSNDTYPVFIGDKVYFMSDRNYTMNIFEYDMLSKEVKQITFHDDYDVRSLKANAGVLVYAQAEVIHVFDPATGESNVIDVYINPDLPETRPRFVNVSDDSRYYDISPTGVRGVFTARGDVFTVPADKGETRNLTQTDDVHERYPAWSPNGDKIAYLSDASGEYELHIIDQLGKEEAEVYSLGEDNYYFHPIWSPDGEKLIIKPRGIKFYYLDLKTKKMNLVDDDAYFSLSSDPWSADNRWITYTKELPNHFDAVMIYDLETGEKHQVTDGMSHAISPVFSRCGSYLYFAASTDWGTHVSGLDMASYERPYSFDLYLAVLDAEADSPFAPESDEEEVEEEDDKEEDSDDEESDEDEDEGIKVKIDFDGLDQRILALDTDDGKFGNLQTAEGYLFYEDFSDDNKLQRYDITENESETFISDLRGYEVSGDGNKLIYNSGGSHTIVGVSDSPDPSGDDLSTSDMRCYVDPRKEWTQILKEVWRLNRDFFYDPDMHGADWDSIYEKYSQFVKYIGHRDDLNYLIGEMDGELVIGHSYRGGGDMPSADNVNVGLLGANYVIDKGRYKFSKIFSGLNWNPSLTAPLTQPGFDVNEGDYLLSVNGIELTADMNIFELFHNTRGKQTTLTINDKPSMKNAHEVIVEPIRSEGGLRLRDWVEGNRKKVDEATDGRAAYIYLPNTAFAGYTYFNRYYFSQLDKQSVIIDERFNGGGSVADYMLDMLDRELLSWWGGRDGKYSSTPYSAIYGPKVMIINEAAGSGGDALPGFFKRRGLGKLVGKRTWGGLVGISGLPNLLDGGYVTVPSFGVISPDGRWEIENEGITPDYDVTMTPKDVIAGRDPQLEKAIEVILEELENYEVPVPNVDPFPTRAKKP